MNFNPLHCDQYAKALLTERVFRRVHGMTDDPLALRKHLESLTAERLAEMERAMDDELDTRTEAVK